MLIWTFPLFAFGIWMFFLIGNRALGVFFVDKLEFGMKSFLK